MSNAASLFNFFTGKTVLITGAGSGIGEALASLFAGFGCKLAVCDIDEIALAKVVTRLQLEHPELTIFNDVLDVASKAQWLAFLANSASACKHIDILINNAGIEGSCQPVWASDDVLFERVMNVNFYGMVHGSKAVLPYLVTRPWAAIVNVSSIFGMIAPPSTADYCASKYAIRGYTESLRAELALVHPHLQVHLVHPGGINTNINRSSHSQNFKLRFLKTEPVDISRYIAQSIMKNKARIVFGNQSSIANFASRFLPLKWLTKITGKEITGLGMDGNYKVDHPGFKLIDSDNDTKTL